MADAENEFRPGEGIEVTLTYSKQNPDGSTGIGQIEVDPANPLAWEFSDTDAVQGAAVDPFDPTTGTVVGRFFHNGKVSLFTAKLTADGDTVPGDDHKFPIVYSQEFSALPGVGATGVSASIKKITGP